MDSEEARHIAQESKDSSYLKAEAAYEDVQFASYNAGARGFLGGLVIGGGLGAAVGGVVAAGVALAVAPISLPAIGGIVAGFSALGMMEGAHKFGDIGVVSGAVVRAQEHSEKRLQEFEGGKFAELKQEIRELKAALTGRKAEPAASTVKAAAEKPAHGNAEEKPGFKPIFWKVAAIGATIGAAAGAIMGHTEVAEFLKENNLMHLGDKVIPEASIPTVMTVAGAAIGASFGVNRDAFRAVFDTTNRLYKGKILPEKAKTPELEKTREPEKAITMNVAITAEPETPREKSPVASVASSTFRAESVNMKVVAENAEKEASTEWSKRVGTRAERELAALLSLDPTREIRH